MTARTDTMITDTERDELSLSLDGAGTRDSGESDAVIAEYTTWLRETGRLYEYAGDLDADIYALYGGERGYETVAIGGDATVAATPAARAAGEE